ncbi:alpha/beta fold hydrolase [Aspergillus clavatus NRRL 1]|uniref:Alpha/beta fold family hydrolase, putative n=1 Tax=Aspergillus clavatus (strain ATCC 1007 / CBS 513.65 / DSM 816 / NCTC 3887 / NRRL 1 / QM 1276 / 107) TaxID=344612 RepID=A1CFN7_ASPCL|nr:alpha/beta fold family hydrolase, putative [Aspergillus clavatus NRRL 1]EAW11686.1 alpha/beta fold family hydrolase, putative [Aspergillus clavatus NRRL 1]
MDSIIFNHAADVSLHARISRPSVDHHKPLLVFLHYWGGSSATWYKLTSDDSATSLSALYPILALDLRGWGNSTGPSDGESAYAIAHMATDVAAALQTLRADREKKDLLEHGFVLIGHSMGAKVAMATLAELPSPLLQALKGLILVAPAPPTALSMPLEMQEQQKSAYASPDSIRWTVENILARPENLNEQDIDMVIEDSLKGSWLAKKAWPGRGMQEDISDALQDALSAMDKDRLRVRILVGDGDVVEPRERVDKEVRQFLADTGVQVSLRTVPGVRHLLPLECPEMIYKEIRLF